MSGDDRYATALAIYNKYSGIFKNGNISIATGANFPDALAGAAYAAKLKMPVILVGNSISSGIVQYVEGCKAKKAYVFGGEKAVSDRIVKMLLA